ncbi:hypothetical protein HMPREF7215_1822 [Pyramidobacter piscolens W5455]|uniref:Uncharacterized protein n=1 Tax=Pyramidobacter piscolens W5455 TaxID=352165 RepID=A0ABM9ZTA1_9BACT|nr:hypothetical protein HMPREF7215_1822 [Pyramidobacter piscolens W5455]
MSWPRLFSGIILILFSRSVKRQLFICHETLEARRSAKKTSG